MHETLRSSFKLQKEKAEWQRITSDSANNTFFSIYAKFYYAEDSFTPTSCDLKIQNYTGAITYGIAEVVPEIKFVYDKDVKEYVFFFQIKLKPLYAKAEVKNVALSFKNFNHSHYEEIENPPSVFSEKHLLFVDLEYINHHEGNLNGDTIINELNFIDQNHFIRDGDEIRGISYIDYNNNQSIYDKNEPSFRSETIISVDGTQEELSYVTSRPCRDIYVRFF